MNLLVYTYIKNEDMQYLCRWIALTAEVKYRVVFTSIELSTTATNELQKGNVKVIMLTGDNRSLTNTELLNSIPYSDYDIRIYIDTKDYLIQGWSKTIENTWFEMVKTSDYRLMQVYEIGNTARDVLITEGMLITDFNMSVKKKCFNMLHVNPNNILSVLELVKEFIAEKDFQNAYLYCKFAMLIHDLDKSDPVSQGVKYDVMQLLSVASHYIGNIDESYTLICRVLSNRDPHLNIDVLIENASACVSRIQNETNIKKVDAQAFITRKELNIKHDTSVYIIMPYLSTKSNSTQERRYERMRNLITKVRQTDNNALVVLIETEYMEADVFEEFYASSDILYSFETDRQFLQSWYKDLQENELDFVNTKKYMYKRILMSLTTLDSESRINKIYMVKNNINSDTYSPKREDFMIDRLCVDDVIASL